MIEKILKRIEEKREYYYLNDDVYDGIAVDALDFACDVIEEVAKEYGNGWIPCSERLPEERKEILVWHNGQDMHCVAWYYAPTKVWYSNDFTIDDSKYIVAWCELPAPYQKGE